MRQFCPLEAGALALVESAVTRGAQRARFRPHRTGPRTIADLAGGERIGREHVAEALVYRGLQRS